MTRPFRMLALLVPLAVVLAGCTEGIDLKNEADQDIVHGAKLFDERCAACHTLEVAGAQGSAINVNQREWKDGPNFNSRPISEDQVLYAIRNGGFSSGPMPQNLAVGKDAQDIAKFLAKYAGQDVARAEQAGETGGTGRSRTP